MGAVVVMVSGAGVGAIDVVGPAMADVDEDDALGISSCSETLTVAPVGLEAETRVDDTFIFSTPASNWACS